MTNPDRGENGPDGIRGAYLAIMRAIEGEPDAPMYATNLGHDLALARDAGVPLHGEL